MPLAHIAEVRARAFTIPTDEPESDGTLAWTATTLVLVELGAGGVQGLGYSYTHAAAAALIREELAPCLMGRDAAGIPGIQRALLGRVRNLGTSGLAMAAVSAVDVALWDLKSRLLGVALVDLIGGCRDGIAVYGSGGFTSYSIERLCAQMAGMAASGLRMVKMKIGRDPDRDPARVAAVRRAIGTDCGLFVDANGAYASKQALALAGVFSDHGVAWFEEPVPSQDIPRMRDIRADLPAGMELAGGEYIASPAEARAMLDGEAVDVLQADVTRCGGISAFQAIAAMCTAQGVPLSAHCAPALHVHLGCALPAVRHLEWFHDHTRIESMLFDGVPLPQAGDLAPDRSRPGLGLTLRTADAERFAA